jgi:DNA (cytosine-5)-methyltransferase 1
MIGIWKSSDGSTTTPCCRCRINGKTTSRPGRTTARGNILVKKIRRAIDLFSGCGGLTLGLKKAGVEVIGAIEIDEKARQVYSANHPEVTFLENDIRDADPVEIMRRLRLRPGELDLLAGCPPCQGFSRIRRKNKRGARADERNMLIDNFALFVEALRPKNLMLENVPGLADYPRFRAFRQHIERLGYTYEWSVLDVSRFGVPQRRTRLILIASMGKAPLMAKPSNRRVTVRDAIGTLPRAGTSGDLLHDLPEARSEKVRSLIAAIPKDGGSRSSLPRDLRPACHRDYKGFNDVFGRMAWDDVSPTITSGCSNPSKGRFLHPEEDRAITLREASILQGFPPTYKFDAKLGKETLALMIGNALPPPFIRQQAGALL